MAISATIGIQVDGAKDAAAELRKVSGEISKTTGAANERRTLRFRQSLAALSRQERQEAFARLSTEDKLTKLTERRAFLERQMLRAQQQGNAYRAGALRLSMANVSGQMAGLGPTGLTKYLSMAGAQAKGFLGGIGLPMMGGMGVAGIGIAAAMLVRNMMRAVEGAASFADNLEDTADMIGLAPAQFAALQKSATMAGVPSRMVYTAVGKLREQIAAAMSGDPAAAGRFAQYKVSGEMLEAGDVIGIGRQIRSQLGPGGMQIKHDKDMRAFFGQRPGMALKIFGDAAETSMSDESIRNAASYGSALEEYDARLRERQNAHFNSGNYFASAIGDWVGNFAPVRNYYASKIHAQRMRQRVVEQTLALRAGGAASSPVAGVEPFDESSMKPGADPSALSGRPTIDALMRIGLFRGGVEARQLGLLRDQVNKLNDIVAQLKTLNREVSAE